MGSDIFDLIIILLLVFFSFNGGKNGFICEVAGIISLIAAFTIANTTHPLVSSYMTFISNPDLRTIITYILLFVSTMLLVSFIARLIQKAVDYSFARWVDRLAGVLFGLAKGLLVCSIIMLVVQTLFSNAQFIKDSHTIPYLTAVIERIRAWLPDDLTARLGIRA
ncbi:MAG: CvpA family protein [Desulfovibrionaceae bacterium]|nr:CvpA family protein [Desulfovibrionaceae bacterium]